MEKSCRKCAAKLVSDPFLILTQSSHCIQEIILITLKEDYQKTLKKLIFFLLNPVPFNGEDYEKQKGTGNSD